MSSFLSLFDIFKIGIGPSSSHTVGPMRAAHAFAQTIAHSGHLAATARVTVRLYGSLALTGRGHGTDRAILMGLEGNDPETVDPDSILPAEARIRSICRIRLLGRREVAFDPSTDMLFLMREKLPRHTNGMLFSALAADGTLLAAQEYYSVGGGFVVCGRDEPAAASAEAGSDGADVPYPFRSADELLALCETQRLSLCEIMLANEQSRRSDREIRDGVQRIWQAMQACVDRGFRSDGLLPGGLKVERRAAAMFRRLNAAAVNDDSRRVMDWLDVWALAVGEENAAGGRVVTAPTNGAAGIVPAVLHYYRRFEPGADEDGLLRFFLAAGAVAILYKTNASISGAEMGCQGEIGVACSMAAAGLVAALSGSDRQIENAAEIGMEHNLGLTCDPVGGLVQIPCIERNTMGAVKAVNAARLALAGSGRHRVSLDQVVATMYQTGRDMSATYKETSLGGLAVNVSEC